MISPSKQYNLCKGDRQGNLMSGETGNILVWFTQKRMPCRFLAAPAGGSYLQLQGKQQRLRSVKRMRNQMLFCLFCMRSLPAHHHASSCKFPGSDPHDEQHDRKTEAVRLALSPGPHPEPSHKYNLMASETAIDPACVERKMK